MNKWIYIFISIFGISYCYAENFLDLAKFSKTDGWSLIGDAELSEDKPQALVLKKGEEMLSNGFEKNKSSYLLTKESFGDQLIQIVFMIPEGSNSGVYVQGRYEIQIFDSFGEKEIKFSDMGSLYQRWNNKVKKGQRGYEGVTALVNAAKPAGEWQKMEIKFRAPRFNENGKKMENARFLEVKLNGQVTLSNVEAKGPTRSHPVKGESAEGPLSIQGDHGPIVISKLSIVGADFSAE